MKRHTQTAADLDSQPDDYEHSLAERVADWGLAALVAFGFVALIVQDLCA